MESELLGTYKGWYVSECTVYRARRNGKVIWASTINGIKHEVNVANKQEKEQQSTEQSVQQPVQQAQPQPQPAQQKKQVVRKKVRPKAKAKAKSVQKAKPVQKTPVVKPAPAESVQTDDSDEGDTYQ